VTTAPAESVLDHTEDSATLEVRVLLLDGEGHHGINHVLEGVATGELTGLANLSDDNSTAVVLLTVICNHSQCPTSRLGIDVAVGILAVIEGLKTINNQEERLVLVASLGTEGITVLQQCRNMTFLSGDEAVAKAQTLCNELDLVEALLRGVENRDGTVGREAVCELEHHGCLSRAWRSCEERHRAWGESLSTQSTIDIIYTAAEFITQLLRYLYLEDVGAKRDIIGLNFKLHCWLLPFVVEPARQVMSPFFMFILYHA